MHRFSIKAVPPLLSHSEQSQFRFVSHYRSPRLTIAGESRTEFFPFSLSSRYLVLNVATLYRLVQALISVTLTSFFELSSTLLHWSQFFIFSQMSQQYMDNSILLCSNCSKYRFYSVTTPRRCLSKGRFRTHFQREYPAVALIGNKEGSRWHHNNRRLSSSHRGSSASELGWQLRSLAGVFLSIHMTTAGRTVVP